MPGRWLRGRRYKIAPHKRPTKLRNGRIPQSISAPGRFVVTDRHTSLGQEPIFRWGLQGSGSLCWCCIRVRSNYDRCLLGCFLGCLLAYLLMSNMPLPFCWQLCTRCMWRAMGGGRDAHQMPSIGVWGWLCNHLNRQRLPLQHIATST